MKAVFGAVVAVSSLALLAGPVRAQAPDGGGIAPATTAEPLSRELIQGGVGRDRKPGQRLGDQVNPVQIDGVSARRAFQWWSTVTRIPLILNWDALAKLGIDPDKAITLDLHDVPASKVLGLMMRQLDTDHETLMYEVTPWYVEVLTKSMANQRPVTRVYDIHDLLIEVPDFEGPSFDLNSALSSSGNVGQGGGGGSTQSLFAQKTVVTGGPSTRAERARKIADLIQQTIEPSIWQANGGQYGSIKYYDGRLVVRAPQYVQDQIDLPRAGVAIETTPGADRHVGPGGTSSTGLITRDPRVDQAWGGKPTPVAGLGGRSSPVSGTH